MLYDPRFARLLKWVVFPAAGALGNGLIVAAQMSIPMTALASFMLGVIICAAILFLYEA